MPSHSSWRSSTRPSQNSSAHSQRNGMRSSSGTFSFTRLCRRSFPIRKSLWFASRRDWRNPTGSTFPTMTARKRNGLQRVGVKETGFANDRNATVRPLRGRIDRSRSWTFAAVRAPARRLHDSRGLGQIKGPCRWSYRSERFGPPTAPISSTRAHGASTLRPPRITPGPPPKLASQRRRRNRAPAVVKLSTPKRPEGVPVLPKGFRRGRVGSAGGAAGGSVAKGRLRLARFDDRAATSRSSERSRCVWLGLLVEPEPLADLRHEAGHAATLLPFCAGGG